MNTYKKLKIGLALALLGSFHANGLQAQSIDLASPAGNIQVKINNAERLTYSVLMAGTVILKDSPMGFQFKHEPDMGTGLHLLTRKEAAVNESWVPVVKSKHAKVLNQYKELKLSFIEKTGLKRKIDVEFRAYDDGLAFRYQLYRSERNGNREIVKELTGFNLASDARAWVADYKSYASAQESEFFPKALSSVPDSVKAGLPFLIEIDKTHYAAITEAKIDNYPGFYVGVLRADGAGVKLTTKLAPLPHEKEDGVKARFSDKLYTPWRVLMLGKSPGQLIESEIIQNLNDPCVLKDVSWIKPGMSAWDHWWSGEVKQDMPTIKKYIDLASVNGWPYMIIDWQWYGEFNKPEADITRAAPQLDMPELLAYAKSKNVRLWLWIYNADVNRNNNFETAFAQYEKWGVAGVKIDFMDRDDQDMVNWYKEIIKSAAAHHLLVDFHGAYKPDGIIRTYPNMITREGVLGEEWSKFSSRLVPEHNVTLPFTRMLAGQMDYTPGGFNNVTKAQFKQGSVPAQVMNTRCQELAKFVVYESPFMVNCEHPDFVIGQPGSEFLKIVPTVWDDIKVLSGYPGEHIALVKQTGDQYFIGAMNNSVPRPLKIRLEFLPAGKYEMTSWADAKDADVNAKNLVKTTRVVTKKDVASIEMAPGGGFVAVLKRVR